jgi:hypothetical protein
MPPGAWLADTTSSKGSYAEGADAMPREQGAGAVIGIIGGSRVVGEALELLLQGLGYRARFAAAAAPGTWPLEGSQILVLAPGLTAAQRTAALGALRRTAVATPIPVIELTRGDAPAGDEHCVHWPCRAEELARTIDAVLAPCALGGRA